MIANRTLRHLSQGGFLLLALIVLGAPGEARAQSFPSKVIRIVVPTTAGTPPDIISRVIASELSESEGWTVVVENRPGALQTIGMGDVLTQPADGYSIFAMSVGVMATPALLPEMGLRPDADFAPVIKVSTSYNVLVVNPAVQAKSVSELVALLKSQPDKLTFSSAGFGTPSHLIGEMFKLQTGVRATHVPYQQFPQAIGDLLGGVNQYMFVTMLPVVDLVNSGKLRALAVTGSKRVPALKMSPRSSRRVSRISLPRIGSALPSRVDRRATPSPCSTGPSTRRWRNPRSVNPSRSSARNPQAAPRPNSASW